MLEFNTSRRPVDGEELLFDWQLDVVRLEKEAAQAMVDHRVDPLCRAEAECSIDMIEAEILALRKANRPGAHRSIAVLEAWRARLQSVMRKLDGAGLDG